jgi:hypothetical protein
MLFSPCANELLTAFLELESAPLDLRAGPLYGGLHYGKEGDDR